MPRVVEIPLAIIGIMICLPVLLVVAFTIKIVEGGPVFYRGRRIGKGGKEFLLLKFRTMTLGAEKKGGALTVQSDPRVTRVGAYLRRAKVDELPQILNVLCGEMSFVGPRPEDPRYVALYTPEQRRVLTVRPGITSPASLCYRDEAKLLSGPDCEQRYIEEILPDKIRMELAYIEDRSTWIDLRIILQTIAVLVIGGRAQRYNARDA